MVAIDAARLRRGFLWLMVGSLAVSALLGIVAVVFPNLGPTTEILLTTLLFGAFAIVALACAGVIERGRLRWLMWGGIASSAVALCGWLALVWFPIRWQYHEPIARSMFLFTTIGLFTALTGLVALPRFERPAARMVRSGTVAAMAIVALLANLGVSDAVPAWAGDEVYVRGLSVFSILAAAGIVGVPVIWKIQSLRKGEEAMPTLGSGRVEVRLACPKCGREQAHKAGGSRCAGCGLKFRIEVAEPVCACGYQLYGITGERCPECGREIAEEDRWVGAVVGEG